MMSATPQTAWPHLTPDCESAVFELFLKAEAMALWAVRSAQLQPVPSHVRTFLRKHEADEENHLRRFEALLGRRSHSRSRLPSVPRQWPVLAVQLYGYEALGLEFARVLVTLRPGLADILMEEEGHVAFFEKEIQKILAGDPSSANQARGSAHTWWRKLPKTIDRYLDAETLQPFRTELGHAIRSAIGKRLARTALLIDVT